MRIRGYDETGELLEDYEELKGKIADLTKTAKTPGGISLFTDATKTEYKSTYQILKDIHEIYSDLTDKQQAGLLEALGGKRGGQVIGSTLRNWEAVEKALKNMENSAGSADAEMEIIKDSIEYKLNYLKQTWVSVLQSTVDRNSFKVFIDFLSAVSEGLGSIISNLGLLKTAIIGIGTVLGTKKLGILSKYDGRYTLFGKHRKADVVDSGTAGFLSTLNSNDVKNLSEADLTARMEAWNNLGNTVNPNVSKFFAEIKSGKRVLAEGQTLLDAFKNSIYNIKKAFDLSGLSLKDFFKNLGSAIKKLGSTLLSGIKAIGAKLLDAVASMGLSYIAAEITSWIFDGIMSLFKDRTQEIIDAGKEAADKANEVISSYENQSKTVSNLRDRYAELAQGVKDLGMATQSQGKLSTDDYAEFLDISNQLAGVFPELKTGITDEGDALLSLNGSAETISSTLDGLLEREQKLAALDIQQQMPDVWSGFGAEVSDISDDYNVAYNKLSRYKQAYDSLKDAVKNNSYANWGELTTYEGYSDEIRNLIEENGLDFDEYLEKSFSSVEFQNLFDSVFNKYQKDVDFFGNQIKSENRKIASYITSLFSSDSEYTNLTSASKSLIDKLVNSIHFDTEYYDERIAGDWDAVYENVKKRSLDVIAKLEADSPELADKFNTAYSEIINYRQSDKTVDQLLDQWNFIRETINNLQISDEDKQLFLDALPSDQDIIDKLDHIKAIMGEHWSDDLQSEFTAADLEVLAKIKLDEDSLSYTIEQIKKYISDATVEPQTKAHDTVKAVEKLRKAVSGLNDLMDKLNDKNFDLTSIDSATLTSIDSAFSDFIQSKKKDGEEVETLTNAYEQFQRVLVQQPGDTEAAKAAVNDLITAYIDQTDIIKGLDESTKQWAIDQLKDMKIKNAEEVINNRLNETNRNALEQTKKMSDAWGEHGDALEQGVENSDSYRKGIKELGDAFAGMFTVLDENGNQVKPVISEDFVKENLDLIKRISAGDTDALNELLNKYNDTVQKIANKPILIKAEYDSSVAEIIYGTADKAVDSIADMKSALSSLSDLYDQTVKKPTDADSNFLFGFADPATLNSIESSFSKYITSLKDADAQEKLAYALREFEDEMVKIPQETNDATEASKRYKNAINQLIDSYLDQTDAVKNLTEENKDWTVALLKSWGITNALEVVESRLVKTNQKLLSNIPKLSDAFRKYGDALKSGDKSAIGFEDGIRDIGNALSNMFAYLSANGKDDAMPTFNTAFILENLELIQQAAEGDVDAINQLREVAAQEIVTKMEITASKDDIDRIRETVMRHITGIQDYISDHKLEVGTSLDTSPMIQGLNYLVKVGRLTRDEVNAALSAIGVVPVVNGYVDVPIEMFGGDNEKVLENMAGVAGNSNAMTQARNALKGGSIKTIRMPTFGYEVGKDITGSNFTKPPASGSTGSGSKSSGSDSKLNEDNKETYDWIEVKLKRLEEAYQRLDKTANAVYETWETRNDAVNEGLEVTKEQLDAAVRAAKRYEKERNNFTVTGPDEKSDEYKDNQKQYKYDLEKYNEFLEKKAEYKRKVENGQLLDLEDDIEYKENKYIKEYVDGITQWNDKAIAQWDDVRNKRDQYFNGYKTIFDNIKKQYEETIGEFEHTGNMLDEYVSRTETKGYHVSSYYYQQQLHLEAQKDKTLRQELERLKVARQEALDSGAAEEGSEAVHELDQAIWETEEAINKSATATAEWAKKLRELDASAFDWVRDKISRLNSEAEFLVGLMGDYKLVTEEGYLNDRGYGTLAMYGIQYDTAGKQADAYRKKIEELNATKREGNQEDIDRIDEYTDKLQDAIKAQQDAASSMKDLWSEAFTAQLNFLQELINKYKESLSDAKDLYSYSKNIANQTKQISDIEKQLQAYSGDDSEESRATIQKLRESLRNAQDSLKETEWDRYISETEKLLDDMYSDYEDMLNAKLDDIYNIVSTSVEMVNDNGDKVKNALEEVSEKWNYDISDNTQAIVNSTTILSDFKGEFTDKTASIIKIIDQMNSKFTDIASGRAVVNAIIAESSTTGTWKKNKNGWWYQDANGGYAKNEAREIGGSIYYFDKNGYMVKNQYADGYWYGKNGARTDDPQAKWHKTKDDKWWFGDSSGWYAKDQTIIIDGKKYKFDKDGYLAEYAKGSKNILSNQLAWTQENGSELIYRKSDGAMLTPLNAGDMVFTNDMTKALWNMAKNPALTGMNVTVPSTTAARTVNNDNDITIVLPNVTNYDEFKTALQKDSKFTNFIQATTLGQSLGKGKLNRGNY